MFQDFDLSGSYSFIVLAFWDDDDDDDDDTAEGERVRKTN